MRISDWSSDVCSSDLHPLADLGYAAMTYHLPGDADPLMGVAGEDLAGTGMPDESEFVAEYCREAGRDMPGDLPILVVFSMFRDRKSVVEGKSVSIRVDLGGRRINKKKKKTQIK